MRSTKPSGDVESLARRMLAVDDEQAYEDFVTIFCPRLRAYFISKGFQAADAESLAVSCLSDIAVNIARYAVRPGGSFEAWVFTIARHAIANWFRKEQPTEPLADDLAAEIVSSEGDSWNSELVMSVREAHARLKEPDRTIIRLRHLGPEHSYDEIGRQLGIRPGTVKTRHFRALKKLQTTLESDERLNKLMDKVHGVKRRK